MTKPDPWSQPPFWERETGGPITDELEARRKRDKTAVEIASLQRWLFDEEHTDEPKDRAEIRRVRARLKALGAEPLRGNTGAYG